MLCMQTVSWFPAVRRAGMMLKMSAIIAALSIIGACGADGPTPPPLIEPDELYWNLQLNHRALTLSTTAPYDTLTLVATPRNMRGVAIEGTTRVQFVSDKVKHVTVSPEGTLVAVAPTEGSSATDSFNSVKVVARLTVGNLTHRDSLFVRVVDIDAPPVLASLSLHPVPPDSAKVAAQSRATLGGSSCGLLSARATTSTGAPLDDLPVSIRSSDTTIAQTSQDVGANLVYTGSGSSRCVIYPYRPGTVTLYAATTAFGATKVDTLPYRVGWPLSGEVVVVPTEVGSSMNTFVDPVVKIGAGGIVFWNSETATAATDVIFADPTNVAAVSTAPNLLDGPDDPPGMLLLFCAAFGMDCANGGNFVIPPGVPYLAAARIFPVPGTYDYHNPLSGAGGRIVVVDEQ